MATKFESKDFIDRLEDYSELVYKHTKKYLPTISRLCLISTFIEDGLRMYFQWGHQRNYIDESWNCGRFVAASFVFFNLVAQLGSCVMVLLQKKVTYACGMLFFIVIFQSVAYWLLWDAHFILRILALIGALLLLVADCHDESRTLFAGVPSIGENKPKSYLQLAGRCLIAFMFITLLRFEFSFLEIILTIFGSILMILVTIGYKTKLSAFVLVIFLSTVNVYHNDWWNVPFPKALRDLLKYDFFQTLSVIGGLLMLVLRGPGGVSLDEHKKTW